MRADQVSETLDELTELTVREFSPVPNRNVDPRPLVNDYPWTDNQQAVCSPWSQIHTQFLNPLKCTIFMQTVKDFYRFEISFPIPYSMPHFRARPAVYLAHFLGHEGTGSICTCLKHKGWLLSLSASPQTWNRGIELFTVSGKLTEAGYRTSMFTLDMAD
jgi:insulysin